MKKNYSRHYQVILLVLLLISIVALPVSGQSLTITKEGLGTRSPGDTISYRLTYTYSNPSDVHTTNVVITDVFPTGDVSYISSDPAGTYDPITHTLTWDKTKIPSLGSLNTGVGIIHIKGQVGKKFNDATHYPDGFYLTDPSQEYTFTNSASIVSDNYTSSTSNTITTKVNQICTATISQASGVIKSAKSSELFYIVAVNNTGNIWNKWVLTSAQGGTGYQDLTVSFYELNGTPLSNNTTPWVAPGASTLVLMKLVTPGGTNPSIGTNHPDNKTTVTATPFTCGSSVSRDFITGICGGQCPDYEYVSTYKIDTPDPVQAGTNLTYRVIIYNSQNKAVNNIRLTETYPPHTTFVSSTAPMNSGTAVSTVTVTGNNQWDFTSLPMGMTTFFITLKLDDDIVNNKTITNRLDLYTVSTTNVATQFSFYEENTLVISAHDLWIKKTADKSYAQPGDKVVFTLDYGNKGNYKGDNVKIVDNYDEVYMEVVDAAGATVANGELTWDLGAVMPIGTVGSITYKLKVKNPLPTPTSSVINVVNIANHQNPLVSNDKDFSNNQDTYILYLVTLPDLKVEKTADKAEVKPGESLTYTITVSNIGDEDHTGPYTITEKLPTGVTYSSSTPAGSYNSTTNEVTWTMNTDLAMGGSEVFMVTTNPIPNSLTGNNIENLVTVSTAQQEKDLANNTFTLSTPVTQNLWLGNISTDWNNPLNWTLQTVPAPHQDVVFATAANNNGNGAERDLILDGERVIGDLVNLSTKALVVPVIDTSVSPVVNNTLLIEGKATVNSVDRILIESQKNKPAGSLIFTNLSANALVPATVEFASISKPADGTWPRDWQFFGPPVLGDRIENVFAPVQGSIYGGDPAVNTIIRKYEEYLDIPTSYQEKWNDVDISNIIVPYQGYEITQPQAKFDNADTSPYLFKGLLVTQSELVHPFTISPSPTYSRGNYILANPYTSPILISNMVAEDFVNIDPTIYIYNTGSRKDWIYNNGATTAGDQKGTYSSIPINTATTIEKNQIPSMQGFMVKAEADGQPSTSFRFRYETIYKGTLTGHNEAMRVRSAVNSTSNSSVKPLIKMDVIGANSSDRVYLITAENTTKSYDPGWDGMKSLSPNVVQLFATNAEGEKLQVNTDSDLNDTYLGFTSGGESTYTLKFKYNDQMLGVYESLYIQDLTNGLTKEITDGMTMDISATAGTNNKRFKLSANKILSSTKPTGYSDAINLAVNQSDIIVGNNTNGDVLVTVYNLVGQPLFVKNLAPGIQSIKHGLQQGTYIIEAKAAQNGEKTILKSVIKR